MTTRSITASEEAKVYLADFCKINRHKTKILPFIVKVKLQISNDCLEWEGKCYLNKDGSIMWEFPKECPESIVYATKRVFTNDELLFHFNSIREVRNLSSKRLKTS